MTVMPVGEAQVNTVARKQSSRKRHLTALGFGTYREYLTSDLWRTIRTRVFVRDGYLCQKCSQPAEQVHHRSYGKKTLAGKYDHGLISLCRNCHHALEFDGDRKRFRREIKKIDREWFPHRPINNKAEKRKARELARSQQRKEDRAKWLAEVSHLPATLKQVARIQNMWTRLGIPCDHEALQSLTQIQFQELSKELDRQARLAEIQRLAAINEELKLRMKTKPKLYTQKTLI
jgi:hypothetical protein